MAAPSFYSDPHVQYLSQLLEEISAGQIQVPRFQRPLVWSWDRRRELLRSIRDGIPIGAIMVWRTTTRVVEYYANLGPYPLRAADPLGPRTYLLDGVQRLSTLYGALSKPGLALLDGEPSEDDFSPPEYPDEEIAPPEGFEVYFDLERGDFLNSADDDVTDAMPLNVLFDSVALLQFQRRLDDDRKIAASDNLARAFRDCKIPIIPITTDDVDMATRTFQRINSQGARMSEAHMVHALTWSPEFDLRSTLSKYSRDVLSDFEWETVDDDVILKSTKAYFDLDIYRTNAQELSDSLKDDADAVRVVVESVGRVAKFLWEVCAVPSPEFVPYSLQIVLLTDVFRRLPEPDGQIRHLLRSWFWMTTYGQLFASMSGDRVQLALEEIRLLADQGIPVWTWKRPFKMSSLPRRFDFRGARAKAMALRLAELQNTVYGVSKGSNTLAFVGKRGVTQLVPSSYVPPVWYSSPANRFLLHPSEVAQFRELLLTNQLSAQDCQAHLVSDEARNLLERGDLPSFLSTRLNDIERYEARFVELETYEFAPFEHPADDGGGRLFR